MPALLQPGRPFDAAWFTRTSGVFYGWIILGFAVLGLLASVPGQTIGVSVFADPLIAATGLSRLALSSAYLVGTVVSGLSLPMGGRWLNRYGERATAIGACVALGLTLVAMSQIDRIADTIAANSAVTAFIVVAIGFFLLRFTGQGLLTLSSRNLVGQWFDARRGLAAGIFGLLMSLGFSIAPVMLNGLIETTGDWRNAWLVLAATVGVGMSLTAWIFYRDTPEQCGLRPDGAAPGEQPAAGRSGPSQAAVSERAYTRSQALHSGPFWAVALVLAVHSATVTGITFNIVDLGAADGLSSAQALALFPPMAVIGVVVGLGAGLASDRVGLRWLVFTMALAETVGYLAVARLGEPLFFFVAAIGLGTSTGLMSTLQTVSMPRLFGRKHLGATSSAQMSILVVASALGPVGLALAHSLSGSYTPALFAAAVAPVAAVILALISRDPERQTRSW